MTKKNKTKITESRYHCHTCKQWQFFKILRPMTKEIHTMECENCKSVWWGRE